MTFQEEEATAIYANYGQVRNYLDKKKLGRGYHRPSKPQTGQHSKFGSRFPRPNKARNMARPKTWSKKKLISNSICARCGKRGHWARTCTNPPDERGKQRQQGPSHNNFTGHQISRRYDSTPCSMPDEVLFGLTDTIPPPVPPQHGTTGGIWTSLPPTKPSRSPFTLTLTTH